MRRVFLVFGGMFLVGLTALIAGCSPASLAFLVMPFVDDKVPPRCKLSDKEHDVTVAVVCSFADLETRPEMISADRELGERLSQTLRKAFEDNKEKVHIVPPAKVISALARSGKGGVPSLKSIGEELRADYVINLDIQKMSFYEHQSARALLRGNTSIQVTVINSHKPSGEGTLFDYFYNCEYPNPGPVDAATVSLAQFRAQYLNRVARDISRYFAAYTNDQRFDFD